jgi:pimeloyl-ACP methyl ester carboxylesterase
MPLPDHRTERVASGDVSLFCRAFGGKGETPIVILHGTNYFDSYDWIGVASALAADREVVAFDHRGFGQSSWSLSKDYSLDALLGDVIAVCDRFGFERPVILGHSMSGRLGIVFAANRPDRLSKLIVVDSGLDRGAPGAYTLSVGNPPTVFESVEAAMAHFAVRRNPPRFALDRARAERALKPVEGGVMLTRDPDYTNRIPQGDGAKEPALREVDVWAELAKVQCPATVVRGLQSDRWTPEILDRLATEFPQVRIVEVDAQHDVAHGAPDALVDAVRAFARSGRA